VVTGHGFGLSAFSVRELRVREMEGKGGCRMGSFVGVGGVGEMRAGLRIKGKGERGGGSWEEGSA
jgi:hypothetical protein